jgi:hypothetical protein
VEEPNPLRTTLKCRGLLEHRHARRDRLRRSVPHLNETLPPLRNAHPGASSGLAAEHAAAPQSCGASLTALYLPREVFFGRLVFADAFVPVCASDFGRFFPATSGSFRSMCPR